MLWVYVVHSVEPKALRGILFHSIIPIPPVPDEKAGKKAENPGVVRNSEQLAKTDVAAVVGPVVRLLSGCWTGSWVPIIWPKSIRGGRRTSSCSEVNRKLCLNSSACMARAWRPHSIPLGGDVRRVECPRRSVT